MLLGNRTFADDVEMDVDLNCAFILLAHVPAKTLLVIPVSSVAQVIVQRVKAAGARDEEIQFHLKKRGYHDYVIKNAEFRPDIPITDYSLDAIWPCIES